MKSSDERKRKKKGGRGFVWSEDDVCDRFDFDKKWAKVKEERKKIKERRKGVRERGGQRKRERWCEGKSDVRTWKVGRKSRERKERKAIDRKRRK